MSMDLSPQEIAEGIITRHFHSTYCQEPQGSSEYHLKMILQHAQDAVAVFTGNKYLGVGKYEPIDQLAVAQLLVLAGAYYMYEPFDDDSIDSVATALVSAKLSEFFDHLWCSK